MWDTVLSTIANDAGELTGMFSFIDYHDVLNDENMKELVLAKGPSQNVVTVTIDDNLSTAL